MCLLPDSLLAATLGLLGVLSFPGLLPLFCELSCPPLRLQLQPEPLLLQLVPAPMPATPGVLTEPACCVLCLCLRFLLLLLRALLRVPSHVCALCSTAASLRCRLGGSSSSAADVCCWPGGLLCLQLGGEQVRRPFLNKLLQLPLPLALLCLSAPCWLLAAAAAAQAIWLEVQVLLLSPLLLLLPPLPVGSACAAASAATAALMASDCDVSISSFDAVSRSSSCCTAVTYSSMKPHASQQTVALVTTPDGVGSSN